VSFFAQLTSTTSLSDEADEQDVASNRDDNVFVPSHKRELYENHVGAANSDPRDNDAVLVDVEDSPKVTLPHSVRQTASFHKPKRRRPELDRTGLAKSHDDVRLLFVDESPRASPPPPPLVRQLPAGV